MGVSRRAITRNSLPDITNAVNHDKAWHLEILFFYLRGALYAASCPAGNFGITQITLSPGGRSLPWFNDTGESMRHYLRERAGARGARYWPVAVVATAAVAVATMTPAATAATRAAAGAGASRSVTLYAVGKRVCAATRPGVASCYAEIRKVVRKGTEGARPFKVAAGATAAGTIGPAGGLTPGDLGSAYGLTTTGGSGQTVAVVDAYNDPNINADLQSFDTHYGLATCSTTNGCLRVVNQAGGSTPPADDTSGWSVEESLDVETVHSVCQGCKIILVEANSPLNADLATAENTAVSLGAGEVSNSFGEPESGTSPSFQAAFNHSGVVITASAGDAG